MSGTVGGPTLHAFCKPATVVVPATPAAHYVAADTTFHRRLKNTDLGAAPSRRHFETGRVRLQPSKKPARCLDGLKQKVPSLFSAILLFVGSVGWCWPIFSELRSAVLVSPAEASIQPHISHCQRLNRCRGKANSEIGKLDPFSSSTYAPSANAHVARTLGTSLSRQSAAIEHGPAPAKHAAKEPKPTLKPPVRLASLERAAPLAEVILSRIPSNAGALTSRGREKPAQDRGSRTEPLADAGRRARSRISEARGERAETDPEAAGPARIARGRGTARARHSFAEPVQRRRTDKSRALMAAPLLWLSSKIYVADLLRQRVLAIRQARFGDELTVGVKGFLCPYWPFRTLRHERIL